MRGYMDYLEEAFADATGWDIDRSYANLILSSSNILDFSVPRGMALSVSSQPTQHSFTTYGISTLSGSLQGSLGYLYSSVPLHHASSASTPLQDLVQCYRVPKNSTRTQHSNKRDTLMYGRMHLPGQPVESMLVQRLSSNSQLSAKWICDPRLISPIVATASLQRSTARWTSEYLWSSHENLVGFRALFNLASWTREEEPQVLSELSSGLEMWYAVSKKAPGVSIATRYSTQSRYSAVPLTLTLVTNPLMGSVSIAYALKPTESSVFASRYDFNLYSYLSDLTIGCELWRSKPISLKATDDESREGAISVFKASTALASQTLKLLWEGSYRGFLVSSGINLCYGDRTVPVHMGIELLYSS